MSYLTIGIVVGLLMCTACSEPTGIDTEMNADNNEKARETQAKRSDQLPKNVSPKLRKLILMESDITGVQLRLEYRSEKQSELLLPLLTSMGVEILSHQTELRQITARAPAAQISEIAELEGVLFLDGLNMQRQ